MAMVCYPKRDINAGCVYLFTFFIKLRVPTAAKDYYAAWCWFRACIGGEGEARQEKKEKRVTVAQFQFPNRFPIVHDTR